MSRIDLLIIGAGPAGMAAATTARGLGLSVTVLDEQVAPGGQIWRGVEARTRRDDILGPAYVEGRAVAHDFRSCGANYIAGAQVWQLEPGFKVHYSQNGVPGSVDAEALILATGAQERPAPFPGWTLPGVMTVGAAQILLKNAGQIPDGPVWIAGSGPLPLLYAVQLLRAGGEIAGYLDTTPAGQWRAALRYLPRALRAYTDLAKGLGWMMALRRSGTTVFKAVDDLKAFGTHQLESIGYRLPGRGVTTASARTLLVHEGVVPNIHSALSLNCAMTWNPDQDCYHPRVDDWGESSIESLFIAGDGAGIAGAKAALLRGELAALKVASQLGRLHAGELSKVSGAVRRKLGRELAARPFLDTMFRPRGTIFSPEEDTIVCRCEEVTTATIRSAACVGRPGPNQIKTMTRAGMGPCQGRQCGYTLTRILSAVQDRPPEDVGYLHVRPPLKPVSLGELAALHGPRTPATAAEKP